MISLISKSESILLKTSLKFLKQIEIMYYKWPYFENEFL